MAAQVIFSKQSIIDQLGETQAQITAAVSGMAAEVFTRKPGEAWSAAEYLQHLNLSVNSVARATRLPPEKLLTLFGKPDHESRSYDAMAAMYRHGLERGIRAEDIPKFMPDLPQDQTHLREDLLAAWSDANQQLLAALGDWSETQLDQSCIGHPALGLLTVREMMFFTIFHNLHHLNDIVRCAV